MRILLATTMLALGCVAATPAIAQSQNREYAIIRGPQTIGAMSVSEAGGSETIDYRYASNGRGPTLRMEIALDARGVPATVKVTGSSTLRVPVDETLTTRGNHLDWRSSVDRGKGVAGGFYLPFNDNPESRAILARALLRADPKAGLALYPLGHATSEVSAQRTASCGGRDIPLRLILIKGVGFTPLPLWLDDEDRLFAEFGAGDTTIRRGCESTLPALGEAQDVALGGFFRELSKALVEKSPPALLIRGARIFDSEAAKTLPPASVLIRGNRIVAVGDEAERTAGDAQRLDATGQTLLPGLWDMHVHLGEDGDALINLANGITGVRDMGGEIPALIAWREKFASGEILGPRLALAGLIDGRAPTATSGVQVSTAEELSRAITEFADNGYQEIKLYSSFPKELVGSAVEQAHSRGLRIGGHVPVGLRMDDVVSLGFDGVSHFNFLMLNFFGDDVQNRTNTLARMLEHAKHGSEIDLNGADVARSIKLWGERHILFDSTALVVENLFGGKVGQQREAYLPFKDRLPPAVAREGLGGGLAANEAERRRYQAAFDHFLGILKRMHDAGVLIVPGTDGTPGVLLTRELELYVKAGIPAGEALQMATLVPARALKLDRDLGTIAPGKLADLILVDGDPATDIGALRSLRHVIRDGRLIDAAALQAAIGMQAAPRTTR